MILACIVAFVVGAAAGYVAARIFDKKKVS
jgi:hypothetical protein